MMNKPSRRRVIGVSIAVVVVATAVVMTRAQTMFDAGVVLILVIAACACGFVFAELVGAAQLAELRRRVGKFVETGEHREKTPRSGMSPELVQLHDAFDDLSRTSVADEKRARQSHEDRSVLIREVHHRVKNNLQVVSSILSLYIHEAPDEATKITLRRVQERVNGLGTVHKDIYENSRSGELPVAGLLHEIADSAEQLAATMGHAVDVERRIAPAQLLPDQVVPLSLLVSEMLHEAVRAMQSGNIVLQFTITDQALVTVRSSGQFSETTEDAITPRFMGVLASQLNGDLQVARQDGFHNMTFSFPTSQVSKPVS